MTQLPLPFGDAKFNLPKYFRSWTHLQTELAKENYGLRALPPGHSPVYGIARRRFLIMSVRHQPHSTEWVVGYFRHGMTWVPLGSFRSYAEAKSYRKQWAALSKTALMKAIWIHLNRPAVPTLYVPAEAALWDQLSKPVQDEVWRLIESGAPGRISEVVLAGRACGLY